MIYVAMSSNSLAIVKLATAKLKMKMLPAGFTVALCGTAIEFGDRHSNRSFLILRISDSVVDAVDVVDVSVSEILAFPPCEHLACSGIVSDKFWSLSKRFLGLSFKSNAIVKHDFFFANIVLRQ